MGAMRSAFAQIAAMFASRSRLWIPFIITALVEALFLGVLWLAPHPPFSNLLAPPVKYFFGERVLHYPWHLWFLYFSMKHTSVAAAVVVGALMTGAACGMVRQALQGRALALREVLVGKEVRYGTVVALWLLIWGAGKGIDALIEPWVGRGTWVLWAAIAATVVLQALLVYAIPASVFERLGWLKAGARSIGETLRHPLSTLAIIALPMSAAIAFAILANPNEVLRLSQQSAPELALGFVAARLVLWTLADGVMTVGAATLWLSRRSQLAAPVQGGPARA